MHHRYVSRSITLVFFFQLLSSCEDSVQGRGSSLDEPMGGAPSKKAPTGGTHSNIDSTGGADSDNTSTGGAPSTGGAIEASGGTSMTSAGGEPFQGGAPNGGSASGGATGGAAGSPSTDPAFTDWFEGPTLDAAWSFIDPQDDCRLQLSSDGITFVLPGGSSHDLWPTTNANAPRILRPAADEDFVITTHIVTPPTPAVQSAGILIEGTQQRFLRADLYSTDTEVRAFFALIDLAGSETTTFDNNAVAQLGQTSPPTYLRLTRTGNLFSFTYSHDGLIWPSKPGHEIPFEVTRIGLSVGNAAGTETPAPAYDATFEYFEFSP